MLLATLAMLLMPQDAHANDGQSANHLIHETSPYLLQHAHNPVDWYPWGPEALERAKAENKVIFLSIGYSACHWCHVMEHESFENVEIAAYLNANYICIKVDREERPDLDDLYMQAVQKMTGSGGWPMTVFLTPELKPFYGGTYFPPESRYGRPGFSDIIHRIVDAWGSQSDEIIKSADALADSLQFQMQGDGDCEWPTATDLVALEKKWVGSWGSIYDPTWGGFGAAPKFPAGNALRWMMTSGGAPGQEMAFHTLRKMATGGMYDQLGGGFARYSTDEKWLIPHFEKMLYDQGTLVPAYLDAWRITGDEFYARIARETCDYLLRERRVAEGGFRASTDADSEGEEGLFFVWNPTTIRDALLPRGDDALSKEEQEDLEADLELALRAYGVDDHGNFEHDGNSALTRWSALDAQEESELKGIRQRLLDARNLRVHPGDDDKVLTAWNGLAISALAQAGRMLGDARYTEAAQDAARFLMKHARDQNGRYSRSWRKGKAQHTAVLEDYAYLARGLLDLFQSTGDESWLDEAQSIATIILKEFGDEETHIFWDTDGTDKTLLHRLKSPWDGAIPSPNAVAVESLVMLHAFTQNDKWLQAAHKNLSALMPMFQNNPRGFAATLRALKLAVDEPAVAVVIGTGDDSSLRGWAQRLYAPGQPLRLVVMRAKENAALKLGLFANRTALDGKATLYLCRGKTCQAPVNDPAQL
ncbi:MAG: thioredoxin domain-containing protein [Planctomycetes bacterium]|jgi:hypothetical protein|nr:thioredoxin domain-containing protein [Planctomycetota bacterium]MBT4029300.1 thioredoxin domain-containing protein [Planctomycetota bacterium]MBT4561285.1 thioredoxin domain-containing protein [Planctomycetota bacterium]MBT5100331.1 thioredoxin domain-containing protein [Planctomycetota bacterium]MBT5120912.1 thioredoxin domain-containing protein [Planctomycetota bacterium]